MNRNPTAACLVPIALAASLVVAACSPRATATPPATPDATEVADAEVPMPALAEYAPRGAEPPPGWSGQDWGAILSTARGQTVAFNVPAVDKRLNEFVGDYVADVALNRYGIEIEVVTPSDPTAGVTALLDEQRAGVTEGGGIDLLWTDDAGLAPLRAAGLLYGPWTGFLPSSPYLETASPGRAAVDGQQPLGDAMPWGRLQQVLVYDSARVAEPPRTVDDLLALAAANPGTFTYPAPPDPIGSAFVRLVCRAHAATPDVDAALAAPVTDEAFAAIGPPCWTALSAAEPAMGTADERHPATAAAMDAAYADGRLWFTLSDRPTAADLAVADGRFVGTTRTAALEDGSWSRAHYLAIPTTARHPAAAMVLANFLLSPEAQFAKAQPSTWGDLTVLDRARVPEAWQAAFADLSYGPATPSTDAMANAALPAPDASWFDALDDGWLANVPRR